MPGILFQLLPDRCQQFHKAGSGFESEAERSNSGKRPDGFSKGGRAPVMHHKTDGEVFLSCCFEKITAQCADKNGNRRCTVFFRKGRQPAIEGLLQSQMGVVLSLCPVRADSGEQGAGKFLNFFSQNRSSFADFSDSR